jgi:ABC-type cobalamin/Fe3+-siderophores transport system ATPase subunit
MPPASSFALDLSKNYGAGVKRGSTFALLGPNCCGKTTLLKILLGALQPSASSAKRTMNALAENGSGSSPSQG